jgi:hypothetical protein
MELVEKYNDLKSKKTPEAIEKILEKRRKRDAGRDIRQIPKRRRTVNE